MVSIKTSLSCTCAEQHAYYLQGQVISHAFTEQRVTVKAFNAQLIHTARRVLGSNPPPPHHYRALHPSENTSTWQFMFHVRISGWRAVLKKPTFKTKCLIRKPSQPPNTPHFGIVTYLVWTDYFHALHVFKLILFVQ